MSDEQTLQSSLSFKKLQKTSLSLLFSAQNHPTGFGSLPPLSKDDLSDLSLGELLSENETTALRLWKRARELEVEKKKWTLASQGISRDNKSDDEELLSLMEDVEQILVDLRSGHNQEDEEGVVNRMTELEENLDEKIQTLSRELINLQSQNTVKEAVLKAVMITKPILGAVHSIVPLSTEVQHTHSTPSKSSLQEELPIANIQERLLKRLLTRRDALVQMHASLNDTHLNLLKKLEEMELKNIEVEDENRRLTERLVDMSGRLRMAGDKGRIGNEGIKEQVEKVETSVKESKAKWEVVRNFVQGVVVGSGVDWAGDKELRALVLECGEEIEMVE